VYKRQGVETYLVAPSSVRVDGGALRLEWGGEGLGVALSLVPLGGGLVGCEAELRGAKGVLHFSLGLHAGEPGFGASKSEALFPGLEWLEGGEPSSSNVTVPPPYNLRAAPHPLKVTVPLMAVRSGDALVALLWSPLQGGGLVAPQFASPNFVEGQANHLMRVFVPPASAARENRDEAEAPVDASREPLRLKAFVYAARATSVLEAVRRWVELFGLPEPSMPRGLEDELRLCARAYLESMWVPGRGWPHAAPGWEPEPYPGYANLLILMACAEPDAQLRQNLLSRAREALELAERRWGPSSLVSGAGCHVPTNQLPFLLGHLEEGLAAWWEHVRGIVLGQGSDGEWGFQPSERPCGREVAAKLGAPGAREVGITATFAAEVLRYARVTGDQRALRAGLRALAAMERYRVPRGAQTWEIHVRAPDLLAAAKALEAYLEGYIATGNATYLERAKYWALAGLPFIYLWSTPDRPVMAYATIPVYASSCLAGPGWFGVPVQWNGLVYAYHLLRLSRYDASFPWAKVAEGILASAMRQQVAVGGRKPLGSYPDSWNLLTNVDQPPYINPEGIAKLALELLNVSTGIETAVVGGVHASAPARIARAELQGGALRLVLQPSCSGWAYVLVSAQAAEVRRGGKPLPRVEALDGAGEGWKVVEAPLRATLIKLSTTRGEEVVVEVALAARG